MNIQQPKKNTLVLIIVAMVSVAAGLWLSQQTSEGKRLPPDLEATFLPKGKPLKAFTLLDHDQQTFNLDRFKGKWSFMFFGYTNCPDVCPMGMKVMQGAWQQLPESLLNHSQMIFVSVDPGRDKPETMKSYVQYFHPDFVGVTGTPDQINILTRDIGILHGIDKHAKDNENYVVNHSGQFILIDPDARMRAVFSPPHEPNKIAETFQKITSFLEY